MRAFPRYFLPYQERWIDDTAPLKIIQKSRQIGITFADAYDSVVKAGAAGARLDVWVSSRDFGQAKLYLEDCKYWAKVLHFAAREYGEVLVDRDGNLSAYVLQFASGQRIYCVSSNPNALAGKRGHVKLDEFALHKDQRLLYRVAKPVTTWGGTLSIISTHRGGTTVFNEIIRDILERGNPMGWSLHTVPIQRAVEEGLVERIDRMTGGRWTGSWTERREKAQKPSPPARLPSDGRGEALPTDLREFWLAQQRAQCLDEEQWLQEYCCVPADEKSAFIPYELINTCTEPELRLLSVEELFEFAQTGRLAGGKAVCGAGPESGRRSFYLGVDVARKKDLCVLDVGEKIGDVVWDRARVELLDRPFGEIEELLYRRLKLPQLNRACLDSTGLGLQLAERALERYEWKVEAIPFTAQSKEELATGLKVDLQKRQLRLVDEDKLRADLRGIRKEVTLGGYTRYAGESEGSHCDRFWAKALRQQAARYKVLAGARTG